MDILELRCGINAESAKNRDHAAEDEFIFHVYIFPVSVVSFLGFRHFSADDARLLTQ